MTDTNREECKSTKHEKPKKRPTFLCAAGTLLAIALLLWFLCLPHFEFIREISGKIFDSFQALNESFREADICEVVVNMAAAGVYAAYMLALALAHVFAFFYFSSRWIANCFDLLDKALPKEGIKMPKLQPVPIPTENHGFIAWMHSVRKWRLTEHWKYDLPESCCVGCRQVRIIVPKCFEFDGASIPRPLWAVLHPSGLLLIQALVHDFAYRRGFLWKLVIDEKTGEETGEVCRCKRDKKDWDVLFKKIGADVNGVRTVNFIAYWAVYLFGYRAWKKNEECKKKPIEPPAGYTEIIPKIIPKKNNNCCHLQ